MQTVTVIGAGSWGSALSFILAENNNQVKIYGRDEKLIDEINHAHTNLKYLPDSKLPLNVTAYTDLKIAIDKSDVILLVVPTKVMRQVLKEIGAILDHPVIFVNASKGIEPGTFKRISQIVEEEIDAKYRLGFIALTGPSHAEEVIKRQLTVVSAASTDMELAKTVQKLFNNDEFFRVYTLHDLIGAELGGSLKNIIALAAGIIAGLGYGDNAKAALITRGLAEMRRLALSVGAKEETLFGLTGIGDLIVTATSLHSRNYQAGLKIGSGDNLKETLAQMTMVVEGVRSCQAAYEYAKELGVEMPITFSVYDVIFNEREPRDVIKQLMTRDLKSE